MKEHIRPWLWINEKSPMFYSSQLISSPSEVLHVTGRYQHAKLVNTTCTTSEKDCQYGRLIQMELDCIYSSLSLYVCNALPSWLPTQVIGKGRAQGAIIQIIYINKVISLPCKQILIHVLIWRGKAGKGEEPATQRVYVCTISYHMMECTIYECSEGNCIWLTSWH